MAVTRALPIVLICVVLLIAPVLLYTGATGHLRVLDEHELVWDNPAVNGDDLTQTLQGRWQAGEFRPQVRPTATVLRALEHSFFGFDRARYQFDQLLLHGINALLLFFLLRRWIGSIRAAALGALLFALHPVASHSLLYLGGLSEILATGFMLATLLVYREGEWQGQGSWVALAALSFLAMTSKEIGFLLPILTLVAAAVASDRRRPVIRTVAPVLSGLAVALAVRWFALATVSESIRRIPAVDPASGEPFLNNLLRSFAGVAVEAGALLAPIRLTHEYSWIFAVGPSRAAALGAIGVAIVCIALALALRKRSARGLRMPVAIVGLALLLPALTVASGGTAASERNLYPALIGWTGCLAAVGVAASKRWTSAGPLLTGVAVGLVLLLGARTALRVPDFKDQATILQSARKSYPSSPFNLYLLGNDRMAAGDYAAARSYYEESLRSWPRFLLGSMNLATALIGQDEYGLALRTLDPLAQRAKHVRKLRLIDAKAHYHAGLILMQQERFKEAAEAFERMLLFYPDHLGAKGNLGLIYVKAPAYAERGIPLLKETLARERDSGRRVNLEKALKAAEGFLHDYIERTGDLPSKRESPANAPLGEPWKTAAAEGM